MVQFQEASEQNTEEETSITPNQITVIIPVLDEEDAILKVINSIKNVGYNNILVIDGYSNDNTVNIVKEEKIPLKYQEGRGKTGAIITAIKNVKTPYFVVMDGDCTYDPIDIESLSQIMHNHNLVIGVRIFGRKNIPIFNRIGNKIINMLFNTIFGTELIDVCSGMYSINTEFANNIKLETTGFDVEVEIAAMASLVGSIGQIPINYYERIGIQKLNPIKDGFKIITSILKLGLKYKKRKLIAILMLVFSISIILYGVLLNGIATVI